MTKTPSHAANLVGQPKFSFTIDEAAAATGLGKTRLYEEMHLGRLKAVKAGRRTLIPAASIDAWLANLPAA
jgi:excisionase family DNA binding protein